jgi:hypothetical protein
MGKGAKNPSWTLALTLPNGQRYTLFGVYANGRIWPTDFKKLPATLRTEYEECLRVAPKFKSALDAGKSWFEADIREEAVLLALKSAVSKVSALARQVEMEKGF